MTEPHWNQMMTSRERIEQLESVNGQLRQQLTAAQADSNALRTLVQKQKLQIQSLTHHEETAARELLFWWADCIGNAPKEDLKEVVKQGYQRIVNLASVLRKEDCTYPTCRCPFDMGPDHQCLKGLPVIRK